MILLEYLERYDMKTLLSTALLSAALLTSSLHAAENKVSQAEKFNAERNNWPDASTIVIPANPAYKDGPLRKPTTTWPPAGTPIKVAITKDDWFSAYKGETKGNAGKAEKWKLKGQIEYSCFDIDDSALKGKVVTGALLHMKNASPKWPYYRVGVSSMAAEWEEGSSSKEYTEVNGAPCFHQAELGKRNWAYEGSTVMDVVMGRGHTIWKFADCTLPNEDGWQSVAVDPNVVAARVAGLSTGFFCYDEVGHEWQDVDDKFEYYSNPNRFSYSKDSQFPPYLEIWVNGEDKEAPNAVSQLSVDTADFPPGEALIKWITPADNGAAGVSGYLVSYKDSSGKVTEMPRYLVPMAVTTGAECRMYVRDIPFKSGETLTLNIKAVDNAGNVGPTFKRDVMLSDLEPAYKIPDSKAVPFAESNSRLTLNNTTISVIDLMDKVHPQTGAMIPEQKPGYKYNNHLFSSTEKKIRLHNGRNEFNFFQILLEAEKTEADIKVTFPGTAITVELFEFAYVDQQPYDTNDHYILPDPLLPVKGPVTIPSTAGKLTVPDQKSHSLICEVYVPHDEKPGLKKGTLTVTSGGKTLDIAIEITVWNFTLPNKLSFVPEMNSYNHANHDVYRLAHKYRTNLNALPYGWSCTARGIWAKDGKLNFASIDEKLGPLFDGSLFKDLPRAGEPVDIAYLPFNEGWPMHLPDHYKSNYWADEAFTEEYIKGIQEPMAAFAKHADSKGWHSTLFHLFMNNKIYFRKDQPKVQTPWILDEPRETSDYWALRWYGMLLYDAVQDVKGKAKFMNRCDISYSQFGRNLMWGTMDWECLGGTNAQKLRLKHDEFRLWGKSYLSAYGAANHIHLSNTQPANWTLQSWVNGCDSLLNWQTRARKNSWEKGWEQAIFLPHKDGLAASVRLRSHTRGQQLIEYLTMIMYHENVPRFQLTEGLKNSYDFSSKIIKRFESDAGRIEFASQSPAAMWKLHMDLGHKIDQLKPEYKAALKEWKTADIDVRKRLPDIGYTPVAPQVQAKGPRIDTFRTR